MKVTFRHLVILFACLMGMQRVAAQHQVDSAPVEEAEIKVTEYRQLDQTAISEYRDEAGFGYLVGPKDELSLWDKMKRWFYLTFIEPLFEGDAGRLTHILIYFLAILGASILFYFIIQGRKTSALKKIDVKWGDVYSNPVEVEQSQFLEWMSEAEAKQDYKEAIKYLYLWVIKRLDDGNIVRYRSEYTNRQVLQKITDTNLNRVFQQIARYFEYVWYGHFELGKEDFETLKDLTFKSKLNV